MINVVITGAGDVGIGTTTPLGYLDVRQLANNTTTIYAQRNTNSGGGLGYFVNFKDATPSTSAFSIDTTGGTIAGKLQLNPANGTGSSALTYVLDAGDVITTQNTQAYRFRQYITTGGGITSFSIEPTRDGDVPYTALLVNSTENIVGVSTSKYLLDLQRNGVSRMVVQSSGYVGIGTTTPGALLQVSKIDATNQLFNVFNSANSGGANNTSFIHTDQNFNVGTTPYTGSALLVTTYPNNVANNSGNVLNVGTSDSAGGSLVSYLVVKAKAGNVGIGTTTPTARLTVSNDGILNTGGDTIDYGSIFSAANAAIGIAGNGTTVSIHSTSDPAIDFGGSIGMGGRYTGTQYAQFAIIKGAKEDGVAGNFGGYMAFGTRTTGNNMAERMRITGAGNVGIGTPTPTLATLQVAGGILSTTGINVSGNGGFHNAANKFGVDVNGAATRFYASGPDGTTPGNYEFHIISSDGTPDNIAMRIANTGLVTISSTITGTGTILDVSSGRSFFSANGEQYAIGAKFNSTGGAVYFGATSGSATPDAQISSAGGGPLMTLKNSGVIQFNTGYGAGTLTSDATGNITSASDERLKTIDGKFTAGLNEVLQIKPILYHWNESSQLDTENIYAGFSAQNIQSVIPVAVMANKDTGYLSLQDRPIIAALVNSIKELEARIKILELK
jgi:hypothetical protein